MSLILRNILSILGAVLTITALSACPSGGGAESASTNSSNETESNKNPKSDCNENASCFVSEAEISKEINNCDFFLDQQKNYLSDISSVAFDPNNKTNEDNKDSSFNKMQELGRIGCRSELSNFMKVAKDLEASATINSNNYIVFPQPGARQLLEIFILLPRLANKEDKEVVQLLSKYANESKKIHGDSWGLKNIAKRSLDIINGSYEKSLVNGYNYNWNPNLPSCSSSYLQINNSRINFVPNWFSYENSVLNLDPYSSVLLSLFEEPRYCDGHNGFWIQSLALSRISFSSASNGIDIIVKQLIKNPLRGSSNAYSLIQKLSSIDRKHYNHSDALLLSSLINSQNYLHPNEFVRSSVIKYISEYCSSNKDYYKKCSEDFVPLYKSLLKDLYYDVRFEAYLGLKNPWAQPPSKFVLTKLAAQRDAHTATLLKDGRLLIVGGNNYGASIEKSEIYDPDTGTWSLGPSPIISFRSHANSLLLPDGRVLIVGGSYRSANPGQPISAKEIEIFDPKTNSFSLIATSIVPRAGSSITLLQNGTVLILGGSSFDFNTAQAFTYNEAEIFDPATNQLRLLNYRMKSARAAHSAVLMKNGNVMISGGVNTSMLKTIEIFQNNGSESFMYTNSLIDKRSNHFSYLLPDNSIFFLAGQEHDSMDRSIPLKKTEAYLSSACQAFNSMPESMGSSAAAQLPNGDVIIAGGIEFFNSTQSKTVIYLFNSSMKTFEKAGDLRAPRLGHTLTVLKDGSVIAVGGFYEPTAERFKIK